jgi:hypothetical protein
MDDLGISEGGMKALRLRVSAGGSQVESKAASQWRDDLRLFGLTWAAGFLFFLLVIA